MSLRFHGNSGASVRISVAKGDPNRADALRDQVRRLEYLGTRIPATVARPVRVYGVGEGFYAMEYVEGRTLEDILTGAPCVYSLVREIGKRLLAIIDTLSDGCLDARERVTCEPCPAASMVVCIRKASNAAAAKGMTGLAAELHELCHRADEAPAPAFPVGLPHGDLDLDNVIVRENGEWVLIDAITHPLETPAWDYAALLKCCLVPWHAMKAGRDDKPNAALGQLGRMVVTHATKRFPIRTLALSYAAQLARVSRYMKRDADRARLLTISAAILRAYALEEGADDACVAALRG